jgi:transcriptional regulator with XRE-family HTH domain
LFEGIIFGNKFREIKNQYGMTQKQFAEKLVSKSVVSLYELSERTPSADVDRMAHFFHVSTDCLFGTERKKSLDFHIFSTALSSC